MKRYIRTATTHDDNSSLSNRDLWELAGTTRSLRIMRELISHPSSYVRYSVAFNPNVSEDILEQLADDTDSDVVGMVAVKTKSPELLGRLTKCKFPDEDTIPVRGWVAGNVYTPEHVLRKLAVDKNSKVRAEVADNPEIPKDLLAQLLDDEDPNVRETAEKWAWRLDN